MALAKNRRTAIEALVLYRLEEPAADRRILGTDGTVFALDRAELDGSYQLAETLADRWKIAVRVRPESLEHQPHKLLAFHGGRLYSVKTLTFSRAGPGADRETPGLLATRSDVPRRELQVSDFEALRIFALTRSGVAAELRRLPHPQP